MMDKVYDVTNFQIKQGNLSFFINQDEISVPIKKASRRLSQASPKELEEFEIDNHGIGIHWPSLDEDLSIQGLLHEARRDDLINHNISSIP